MVFICGIECKHIFKRGGCFPKFLSLYGMTVTVAREI